MTETHRDPPADYELRIKVMVNNRVLNIEKRYSPDLPATVVLAYLDEATAEIREQLLKETP